MSRYCVIDTETNNKNKGDDAIGNFNGNPHCPANGIVHIGYKVSDHGYYKHSHRVTPYPYVSAVPRDSLVVLQNASFDLLYLMKNPEWYKWLATGHIWCTQLAEYILTGQEAQMISLDELSVKYGGTLKDDRIKELWEAGIDTEDIDDDLILPYMEQDVLNTEIVARAQMAEAYSRGILPLMRIKMDSLLATIEMEYNGVYFDKVKALDAALALRVDASMLKRSIEEFIETRLPGVTGNANSNDHISLALFGGTYKTSRQVELMDSEGAFIRFKSGAKKGHVRTKKVVKELYADALLDPDPAWALKKVGFYSVNEEVLTDIAKSGLAPGAYHGFVNKILRYRSISKDISTYYEGYSKLVWPHDSCLHPSFLHCRTDTGRLSCVSPNVQNAPGED